MTHRIPPLNALRAFEAACRHRSFTRAAAELNLTQGAISHRIRGLEDSLGAALFHRVGRQVVPTEAGAAYAPIVRAAFDLLAEGGERLFSRDSLGPLTLTLQPAFAMFWLIPRLGDFQRHHPDVEVRLDTTLREIDLAREDIDIGIRYGRGDWAGLKAERLFAYDMIPVCGPSLLKGPAPLDRPADLVHHTLLHAATDLADWRLWLRAAGVEGVDPERGPTFDSTSLALTAAGAGLGLAIAPHAFVKDDLEDGWLVAPFAVTFAATDAFYLVYPPAIAAQPRFVAFRDWLLAAAAREGAGG